MDFDSPDYAMREYLKRNVWKFSVAKNYNDSIRLSNLLVRKDGSLRPWNEFKREALMVVGESNRYLKTEYNTVVSGAQMSRMWQEIQRDKHIFPFVQFDVVKDGRTSDICSPLDKLIFEVDSPVLAYYFPPNHFNCRTRVRKLRNGVPSKNYTLPDIPTEFKNNAGMCPPAYKKLLSNDKDKKPIRKECGEIFTEENRYIKNTPKEVLDEAKRLYLKETLKDQRKEIKEWAKQNLVGKTITHPNIDGEIHFTTTGIKEALNQPHKHILEKNEAIKDIVNLIKKSVFIRSDKDSKGRDILYHYFATTINSEISFITIKKEANRNSFYTITDSIKK